MFKNFSFSIFFKIISAGLALFLVPLLLNILGKDDYGTWVALTSLLVWISLFDFGVGHALKNSVARGFANNNLTEVKSETIQTLKFILSFCFLLILSFFIALNQLEFLKENHLVALILFVPAILIFPLTMGNMILQGARKIALQSGLMVLGPIVFFCSLSIGSYFLFSFDLFWLSVLYSSSITLSLIIIWVVATKQIGLKFADYKTIPAIPLNFNRLKIGVKFFGLQISSISLYNMGPLLIVYFMSSSDVTHFDLLNKIYTFALSFFLIGIAVFWPELTYHKEKNDFDKISKIYFTMVGLSFLFSLGAMFFAFFVPFIIEFWIGDKVIVTWEEGIYFSMLISIQAIAYSGAVVLNAFEKINIQLIISSFSTILMVPLTYLFINDGYGVVSVPIAACLLTLAPAIYCNVHAFKIIKRGA